MTYITGSVRTLYASGARTATPAQVTQTSAKGERGGHFIIVVTAVTATPSVVPTIEGYDRVSDTWYTLLTGTVITATGTTVLKLYPGIAIQANATASDILPPTWRLTMTHGDADSITYSASASLVP